MTSNFALSLSFEGISLLHRVPDGWDLVGEVPLDSSNLSSRLADLRQMALALDPSGLRTKLVIPPEQIRFMTLDKAAATPAEVGAALEGTTPYALSELVIDFESADGRTHIAAVAQETLDEAVGFAREHDLNPVACVAVPEPQTFAQEVFFGVTPWGDKDTIARDDRPVMQTGVAVMPPLPDAPDEAPSASSASAPEPDAPKTVPTVPPATRPLPPEKAAEKDAPRSPARTGQSKTSALPPAAQPADGAQPKPRAATPVPPPVAEPSFSHRKEPPRPQPGAAPAAPAVHRDQEVPSAARQYALAAAAAPVMPAGDPIVPTPTVASQRQSEPNPQTAHRSKGSAFGISRRKPRYLGLMLTLVLLLVLFAVGVWAATQSESGITGWFRDAPVVEVAQDGTPDVTVEAEPGPDPAAVVEDAPAQKDAPVEVASVTPPPAQTAPVRVTAGRVLSPDEADRIYAATGVYQRAPRISVTPEGSLLEDIGTITTVVAPEPIAVPDAIPVDAVQPDEAIAAPALPPAADVVFERDRRGNILATAEGTLTPEGAWVIAGAPELRPQVRPGTPIPDTAAPAVLVVTPELRPDDLQPPAPAAEDAPPLRPRLRPADAALAAQPGDPAEEELEEEEPAEAEEAKLPFAIVGARPRSRPDGLTPEVAVIVTAYTGTRPILRPAGIAPPADEAVAEAAEAPEDAPTADINAVAAAIAAAAPRSTFVNRTKLAISVTPRPAPRPQNFARVVQRATPAPAPARVAAAPTRTAAIAATPAPPTVVAPSGNIPGGVARAATRDGAMNLRQMNLVGVYGKPNQRRALVRLGNGRYVKVEVGSALDGGQVTAIGDSALNFVKRGKTYALVLPS